MRRAPVPPIALQIGIISDTHGLLRPQAEKCLAGVDHIIHGGDIGSPDIIPFLHRIAPVTAIRGNVDIGGWTKEFPETITLRFADRSIFVLHDLEALDFDPVPLGIDVVASGHSHMPKIETINGVLCTNPGSAGRRRFKLPITLATIELMPDSMVPSLTTLLTVDTQCRPG